MELKKCNQHSIVTLYGIWLFFIKQLCVVFCVCGWHFLAFSDKYVYVVFFFVFSFCYTLNHQFKGVGEKTVETKFIIYCHLGKYHIFWIPFEFCSSNGKLVKFAQNHKSEKWSQSLFFLYCFMIRHGSHSYILLNTSPLNRIPTTVVQRCRQQFSHSKKVFSGPLHFVLSLKNIWMWLFDITGWSSRVLVHTMRLSWVTRRRGKVKRASNKAKREYGLWM